MANIYPVILSGGSGTRLWPLSREAMPKQFLQLLAAQSPFQQAVLRSRGLPSLQAPVIVGNNEHRFLLAEQLRAIDVQPQVLLLEPAGRNTAPAAAVAAYSLVRDDPEALMLVLPADHFIAEDELFRDAVMHARSAAESGHLVTFGIVPRWAETGYGYIERGALLDNDEACRRIASFVEKPALEIATKFVASGEYLWNSGMFLFRAATFLEELARLQPALAELCGCAVTQAARDLDFCRLDAAAMAQCKSISIDHAVFEHTQKGAVLPIDFGWSDLGSWKALWEAGNKDSAGNVVKGDVYLDQTANSYVAAERRLVAVIGVDNLIVVETPDAVLVSARDQVQRVREIVDHLRSQRRSEHVHHRLVHRPWGSYEDIDAGDRFRVKRITVSPGRKLSLQLHHHRAEHWVVVQGTARITRGDEVVTLTENQSTYIPLGVAHRLENPGRIPLQIIEVQSGAYLEEDDIVRLEDVYNRT